MKGKNQPQSVKMIGDGDFQKIKKIGVVAHSYEGATLCFLTMCREGGRLLGAHMHPNILLSAIPMGLSMAAWESNSYDEVKPYLFKGVEQVAKSGADFFICPDNTAHIVLEDLITSLPIPGLHIAEVVCCEIQSKGWKKAGLLGTRWTMTGPVYKQAFQKFDLQAIIPDQPVRDQINAAIFEELCQGIFRPATVNLFVESIHALKEKGAECVILGCTEIPLIITADNASLPVLDSTRLLARYAVELAISEFDPIDAGWISPGSFAGRS